MYRWNCGSLEPGQTQSRPIEKSSREQHRPQRRSRLHKLARRFVLGPQGSKPHVLSFLSARLKPCPPDEREVRVAQREVRKSTARRRRATTRDLPMATIVSNSGGATA